VSDLLPAVDGLSLGETTTPRRWKGNKLILDAIESALIPDVTKTRNLGSGTKYWASAYIQKLMLSTAAGEGASTIVPRVDASYGLGSPTYRWATIYALEHHIRESGVNTYYYFSQMGNELVFWYNDGISDTGLFYFDGATPRIELVDLAPISNDARDLGTSDLKWRNLFLSQYLLSGKVASLPTADSSYRGKIIRVEGGAGVADKLYVCMKSASDAYSWVQVASG